MPARRGGISGAPSRTLPARTPEVWTCTGCGRRVTIQTPALKTAYPHTLCRNRPQGEYRP